MRLCAFCTALALVLTAPALASGDIAFDLNGSLEAADPAAVEAMIQQEEAAGVTDMSTADVVMGYIAPEGAALSAMTHESDRAVLRAAADFLRQKDSVKGA